MCIRDSLAKPRCREFHDGATRAQPAHEAFVGVARPGVDLERESVQCAELGLELLEDARAPGAPFSLREGLELEIVGRQLLAGRHQTVQRRQHIPAPTGALHVGAARAEQRRDEEVLRRRRAGRLPSHAADQADAILRALARRGHALIPRAAVSRVRIRPFASPWPMTTRFRARSPDPEADRRPLQTPTYHETAGRGLTPGPAWSASRAACAASRASPTASCISPAASRAATACSMRVSGMIHMSATST